MCVPVSQNSYPALTITTHQTVLLQSCNKHDKAGNSANKEERSRILLQKGQIGIVETWMPLVPDCSANLVDELVKQNSAYSGSTSLWVKSLNSTIFKNFLANTILSYLFQTWENCGLDWLGNVSKVKTWWIIFWTKFHALLLVLQSHYCVST